MKKIILIALTVVMMICFAGCGQPDDIDISGYQCEKITITGAQKEKTEISIKELKNMEAETTTAESTSDKIGKLKVTGVWLDTVLEPYGVTQSDYSYIVFHATDGYTIKIPQSFLKDNPVMLAYGVDGEPLDEEAAPCRVIIKDSDSAYWIRKVNKVQLKK